MDNLFNGLPHMMGSSQANCTINGQPASCGKVLGIFAAIGIPFLIVGLLLLLLWVLAVIHIITHKDVSNRGLWAIFLVLFSGVAAVFYYFLVMRPYKKGHPDDVGAVTAVRNIAGNVGAMAQNPAQQSQQSTPQVPVQTSADDKTPPA